MKELDGEYFCCNCQEKVTQGHLVNGGYVVCDPCYHKYYTDQ